MSKSKLKDELEAQGSAREADDANDAIAMIKEDHKSARAMFERFDAIKGEASADQKQKLAQEICEAVALSMAAEEEFLYPAAGLADPTERSATPELSKAHPVKALVAKIGVMSGSESDFDAAIDELSQRMESWERQEAREVFSAAKESGADLAEIGLKMRLAVEEAQANKVGAKGPALKK